MDTILFITRILFTILIGVEDMEAIIRALFLNLAIQDLLVLMHPEETI